MCLEIKKGQRVKIAKEDIKCYKVISYKGEKWITYYQKMHIYPGVSIRSDIIVEISNSNRRIISKALHSFTIREEAIFFLRERIVDSFSHLYKIIECSIPKGSKYYIGEFNRPRDSYASDTLIYPNEF